MLFKANRFLAGIALLAFLLVLSLPARAEDAAVSPEIEKLLALPEDKIDIGIAALTFAHEILPGNTDIDAYSKKIDQLVTEVRMLQADARARHFPVTDGPDDTVLAINEVFYKREGYKYDLSPDARANMMNSFLPGTIERKLGICSTMPMLYMAIAQRLGLPVYVVDAPDHNFLRLTDPHSKIKNIEVTSGGGAPSDAWYIQKLHISDMALKSGAYMRTITHHQYLAELLITNGHFWLNKGQEAKGIKYYTRAMQIDPQNPEPALWLMKVYLDKSMKAEDDFIYSPKDSLRKQATDYLDNSLSYRNKLTEMGVSLDDYMHDPNAANDDAKTQ